MADRDLLPLGNDYEVRINVTAFDIVAKEVAPVEGRTITAHLAATPTGAAIHADVSLTLTDIEDGDYFGVLQGAYIDARITVYLGQSVWLRIMSGSSDVTRARELLVTDQDYLG